MEASVVVPSMNIAYLEILLVALASQTIKPHQLVIVSSDKSLLERAKAICKDLELEATFVLQLEGYFTKALNLGKEKATGDIVVFTDDDSVPFENWIENYLKLFLTSSNKIAGISSRDVYYDISSKRIVQTPDDKFSTKMFRHVIRRFDPPITLLEKYRLGVYLNRNLMVVHGRNLPYKSCFSLPFRGVNMAFRRETIRDVHFPEAPNMKLALGNEAYFGIQLVIDGYDLIYTPANPTRHLVRSSLSRNVDSIKEKEEEALMKKAYKSLLARDITNPGNPGIET